MFCFYLRYRERLKNKYLTKKSQHEKEVILDSKQWVFVKDGLDDFRDGKPPPQDDILIKVCLKQSILKYITLPLFLFSNLSQVKVQVQI